MVRSTKNGLLVAFLFLLAACGGGDPKTPPPVPVSDEGKKQMDELHNLAANASQTCCSSAAPYMVAVGAALQTPNPQLSLPQGQPNMSQCQQAIMNFELLFRSIDNGQYANRGDAQKWREDQGKSVINCVGDKMQQAGLPVNPGNIGMYFAAAQSLTQQLQGAVPNLALGPPRLGTGSQYLRGSSSLGDSLGPNGYGFTSPTSTATNPYAISPTSSLGGNPFGSTSPTGYGLLSSSSAPQLSTSYGAPSFLSPNAANQIFLTLPSIPQGM
jgi:hypothetical protein